MLKHYDKDYVSEMYAEDKFCRCYLAFNSF